MLVLLSRFNTIAKSLTTRFVFPIVSTLSCDNHQHRQLASKTKTKNKVNGSTDNNNKVDGSITTTNNNKASTKVLNQPVQTQNVSKKEWTSTKNTFLNELNSIKTELKGINNKLNEQIRIDKINFAIQEVEEDIQENYDSSNGEAEEADYKDLTTLLGVLKAFRKGYSWNFYCRNQHTRIASKVHDLTGVKPRSGNKQTDDEGDAYWPLWYN